MTSRAGMVFEDIAVPTRSIALDAGDTLVQEGDDAAEVFLVQSGRLGVFKRTPQGDVTVGEIGAGEVVGEVAIVAGGQRMATLRAVEPALVTAVPSTDFVRWLGEHPDAADPLVATARKRFDISQLATMISTFADIDDVAILEQIVERVDWHRLDAGDVLFREGDPSDAAHFIVSGRLAIIVGTGDGGELTIREVGRGDVVGELGLLEEAPRSATVRAVRDTTLATFRAEVFRELVANYPPLMLQVTRGILGRLHRSPKGPAQRATSVAIAITSPQADAARILDAIAVEIARHGSVQRLSSRSVDAALARPAASQATAADHGVPRLDELLYEAEVANDHLLLEADGDVSAWTARALRQSDRAVIISSARPDGAERRRIAELTAVLDTLPHVDRTIALLHAAGTDRPRNTAAMVELANADDVAHLREGNDADVARLARMASGHAVGLVLGGGGARGFAHVGVFRALRELGVPVDIVGGCSIGAPIGAGIALDLAPDDLAVTVAKQFHRLLDYTLPMVSVLKGRRISNSIGAALGDREIEDLWLPFFCVSTNLATSRLEIHRRGPTATFIRASVSIPGVLPPVPYAGQLLVDGGVLDNLPVAAMRADPRVSTVIAVDVAPAGEAPIAEDYGLSVSGWRAVGMSVRRRRSPYPKLPAVVLRSMLSGALRQQTESLSNGSIDLLISISVPGIGMLDFGRVREVTEVGYRYATPVIRSWLASRAAGIEGTCSS